MAKRKEKKKKTPDPSGRGYNPWGRLPPLDGAEGHLNVVIETVQWSRHKLRLDPELGVFTLAFTLPAGAQFPYDFGFVPSTLAADGDPIDVLLLMDGPAAPGCLVRARLLGVIEADQTERSGKTERNDRLIAVAEDSSRFDGVKDLEHLGDHFVEEIEAFFRNYNAMRGKRFKPLTRRGPKVARKLVMAAAKAHRAAK